MARTLRIAGAVAALGGLMAAAVLLAPAYIHNFRFQQYLEELTGEEAASQMPVEALQVAAAARAGALGIPLKPEDVKVDRTGGALRIEARYIVRVDLPVYTVDLHFRARSGAR